MEQKQMDETDRGRPSTLWRLVRVLALSLVLCFLTLSLFHYVFSELKFANRVDLTNGFAIAFFVLALGCGLLLVREVRQAGGDPLTRQERLNRNLQIIAGLLGFVLALTIDLTGGSAEDGALSNEPLPPIAAILLILVLGLLVPAISIYWHRIIDEQEADASKTGALFAFYVFGIGAPLWWLAWRGGFAPPPNGFIIYFATMFVMTIVWLWKKYV